MAEFRMPSLGAGMDTGTLLEWYVAPGDEVHRGQVVALVETDKAAIEVEVFADGVVDELVVAAGAKVPVGTVLARLGEGSTDATGGLGGATASQDEVAEAPPSAPADAGTRVDRARPAGPAVQSPLVRRVAAEHDVDLATVAGTGPGGLVTRTDVLAAAARAANGGHPTATEDGVRTPVAAPPAATTRSRAARRPPRTDRPSASPYARRLADERRLDLASVTGTGPGGAVVARDLVPTTPVATATPAAATSAATTRSFDTSAMRGAIARAMEQSNHEVPQYHLGHWVDVEQALRRLEADNADRAPAERVLPAALVLRATALACREHPGLNGTWVDGAFRPADGVHVGVAISLRGGGLVAPAIHDADQLDVEALMAALSDLVRRARAGRLRGTELTDPTITVTNLGDRGVDTVHGLVHPPQVALVGAGRITRRPWAIDDLLAVRRVVHLTLAADHRASDGHLGGRFLATIAHHLTGSETS